MLGTIGFRHAAFAAAVFLSLAPAAVAQDKFGAIAYSPQTGAHGWSEAFATQSEAEEAARVSCARHASDCRTAAWFKNACGALATGPNGWGADWGRNTAEAQAKAIDACVPHSKQCRILKWLCTGMD
ncbi:DUF4189 domain-containing protein [Rhizobium sp. TRM95111]|uniref:DUF4189 domain-containing protein n=1 Tax=Rhizobium alarense TaxID=2846851 RepID=UPI001F31C764|nr:DUF4189 domain-containing protein [Rhizobium alarense]MCF3640530.1 DUF4189 domain-containing protein [Rhizobium alarense]